jgi:hypothetical protein
MLEWIIANPNSNLYPRQLPIAGLDSKWLEGRKGLLSDLVATIKGEVDERDFFQVCGLKPLPHLIRMRILDQVLSKQLGGLTDILAPWEELAYLDLSVTKVFVVENLQTGLAFPDIPGAVVFMRLGYNVDVLARLPWIAKAKCIYWRDLDTHGGGIELLSIFFGTEIPRCTAHGSASFRNAFRRALGFCSAGRGRRFT